jgi:F-type H+-transporting ATPase subunit b
MEQLLHALAGILQNPTVQRILQNPTAQQLLAILQKAPLTIALLLLLHFYLKAMLFGPLEKVLKEREQLTKGARQAAEQGLAAADRKTQEYEAKLREARAEVYKEQEEMRRRWIEDQASQAAQARERNAAAVRKAREEISAEAGAARLSLTESSGALADQIATAVLAGRAG